MRRSCRVGSTARHHAGTYMLGSRGAVHSRLFGAGAEWCRIECRIKGTRGHARRATIDTARDEGFTAAGRYRGGGIPTAGRTSACRAEL